MKLVKLSVFALTMGLFVASCGSGSGEAATCARKQGGGVGGVSRTAGVQDRGLASGAGIALPPSLLGPGHRNRARVC